MKFFAAVKPGEEINLQAEKIAEVDQLLQFKVRASVNGKPVAEGQLVLNLSTQTPAGLE